MKMLHGVEMDGEIFINSKQVVVADVKKCCLHSHGKDSGKPQNIEVRIAGAWPRLEPAIS
jgi:hypothetical protein